MQTVLVFYCAGLLISALLGVFLSIVIFRDLEIIVSNLTPGSTGRFVSRFIKISLIFTALIGGISAKFYSCQYKYDELINNPITLTMKVAGQIEGALRYLLVFLLLFFGIAVATTVLRAYVNRGARQ